MAQISRIALGLLLLSCIEVSQAKSDEMPADAKWNNELKIYSYRDSKDGKFRVRTWTKSKQLQSISIDDGVYRDLTIYLDGRWYERIRFIPPDRQNAKQYPPLTKQKNVPNGAKFSFELKKWEMVDPSGSASQLWWPEGSPAGKVEYAGKHYHGKAIITWENGKLCESRYYLHGKREGEWKEFYESGALKSLTIYKDGKRHGWHKIYDEKGELTKELFYQDGHLAVPPRGK